MDGSKGAFSLLPQPLLYVRAHNWSKYSMFITRPPCCFPISWIFSYWERGLIQIGHKKKNCLLLNKQNIALGGHSWISYVSAKIVGQMCFHVTCTTTPSVRWKTSTFKGVKISVKKRKLLLFSWGNLSRGQNQVIHRFSQCFTELVHEFVLIAVIRAANAIQWIA